MGVLVFTLRSTKWTLCVQGAQTCHLVWAWGFISPFPVIRGPLQAAQYPSGWLSLTDGPQLAFFAVLRQEQWQGCYSWGYSPTTTSLSQLLGPLQCSPSSSVRYLWRLRHDSMCNNSASLEGHAPWPSGSAISTICGLLTQATFINGSQHGSALPDDLTSSSSVH